MEKTSALSVSILPISTTISTGFALNAKKEKPKPSESA